MGIVAQAEIFPCKLLTIKSDYSVRESLTGLGYSYDAWIAPNGIPIKSHTMFEIFSARNWYNLDNVPETLRDVTACEGEKLRQTDVFCGDMPNAETLEAIEEVRRMEADPSLGKAYTDVEQMFNELLSDV